MKKSTIIIIAAIVSALITFYEPKEIEMEQKKVIEFVIIEESLTKTGATFILTNNFNISYTYGSAYEVEKKVDGYWQKLDNINELVFDYGLHSLKKSESKEVIIDWSWHYGELKLGTYRLVKTIREMPDDNMNTHEIIVRTEFDIK